MRRTQPGPTLLVAAVLACAPPGGGAGTAPHGSADPEGHVTMRRLPCFGTCAVYTVSVAAAGTVTFEGERFVDSVGTHVSRIAPADASALLRALDDDGFFRLEPRYVYQEKSCGAYHTDAPRVILSVTLDGRTATVEHDYGCTGAPGVLRRLQERVDSVAGVARWTGGAGR